MSQVGQVLVRAFFKRQNGVEYAIAVLRNTLLRDDESEQCNYVCELLVAEDLQIHPPDGVG